MSFDKIIYRLTDKRIPAATGIGLVGDILDNAGFQEQFSKVRSEDKRSRKQIDCGAIMTSFIGLLCMGKPDFEAIAEFQNDAAYYQTALHLKKGFPSAATLRQRMDEIGKTQREQLLDFNARLLKSNHVEPTALKNGMIPLDMDVTPMDNSNTKKEGVSFTYKKFGECEQFHSEIKTDMGVERLPSGKFDTNELVLELTMIAYNILRMLGQETVNQGKAPAKRIVSRKRIRTVIQNIIHFAGQLSRHARQLFLSISRSNAWADAFWGLARRFAPC